MTAMLRADGQDLNRKRVRRLMRKMGIEQEELEGVLAHELAHAVEALVEAAHGGEHVVAGHGHRRHPAEQRPDQPGDAG